MSPSEPACLRHRRWMAACATCTAHHLPLARQAATAKATATLRAAA